MAIKTIVELQAKPGLRDELQGVLESLIAAQGPGQGSFLGSTRYGVLDDPDVLVEIADWESAEAREAHMREAAATGAYAPLLELLAVPFRVTVISQLPCPDAAVQGTHRKRRAHCHLPPGRRQVARFRCICRLPRNTTGPCHELRHLRANPGHRRTHNRLLRNPM